MNELNNNNFLNFVSLCGNNNLKKLSKDKPVFIFGAGPFGRDLCAILNQEGFNVHGFIETNPKNNLVNGLPVLTWANLKSDQLTHQLAIGIYNRSTPLNELKNISTSAGFSDVFMPWDLYSQFEHRLGWRYWLSTSDYIVNNIESIELTYNLLEDDASKEALLNICKFRMGLNNDYSNFRHEEQQYFNSLTLKSSCDIKIVYVDGGAYIGDTLNELTKLAEISSAYLFEPDPENYLKLTQSIDNSSCSIECIPLALSDKYQILSFNAGNGEGGAITNDGEAHIAAVALDQFLGNKVINFIKLDVEGGENNAIIGAKKIIKNSKPILAISLYHKPQDIWDIPLLINDICNDYKFYIRQHFFNSFETVLYAIPK